MSKSILKKLKKGEKLLYHEKIDISRYNKKKKTLAIYVYLIEIIIIISIYVLIHIFPIYKNFTGFLIAEIGFDIILFVIIPLGTYFIYFSSAFPKKGTEFAITSHRIIASIEYGGSLRFKEIVYFRIKRGPLDKKFNFFSLIFSSEKQATSYFNIKNLDYKNYDQIWALVVTKIAEKQWEDRNGIK